ncbi:MAG TPA: protein kinase [Pyrinomonadaceae bacterium]|jgi:serine/threonine protein kinase/TolB-like protein/tetratricopeptide (TPR) repeat protein
MTIAPGTSFGRYQIRSPLGAGGMGEVYLAQDTQLERAVALKLLPAQFTQDTERVRRFQQEARATSALNHPNILTIFEIGEEQGTYFIATEFINGQTLRDRLVHSRLPLDEALDIAIQVAGALAAAHAEGIIHRDIKPENIMLRADGYVKVLDFGLAKLSEPRGLRRDAETVAETMPGLVIGTITYMSPEQARGLRVDQRTDIFSLGVVLYEMVAGRQPFGGPTPSDVIVSILEREPLPLKSLLPAAPPELEQMIARSLAKEREARYTSIAELLEELRGLKRRVDFEEQMHRTTPDKAAPVMPAATSPEQPAQPLATDAATRSYTAAAETRFLEPDEETTGEIAHVLFMDLVGFSKHWSREQPEIIRQLNGIVRETESYRRAEARGQIVPRSSGDGMALVFFGNPEAPLRCALQIARIIKDHEQIKLRMGIHSGLVFRYPNIAGEQDVYGEGINFAQRVMDAGDVGHILLSKQMVNILREFGEREEQLDDLGETMVKHGVVAHLFNLYTMELGNPARPSKLDQALASAPAYKPLLTEKTLAVMPLVNVSGDPNMEYLSDGITESIINTLSQLGQLRVMARSTVFRYKGRDVDPCEAGRELQASAVTTGRVLLVGDNLIIKAELVNVADGSQLWGEQYRRKSADIFEVEAEISKEISEKLRIKLTGAEKRLLAKRHTDNPEAYQLYLKGRFYLGKMTKDGLKRGIEYFNRAIELDPGYALAYAGLAEAYYGLSAAHLPPREAMPRARAAAMKALELDDTLAEAHASLGLVQAFYDWDWTGAEREYRRAIELNHGYASAHHWYGWYLALMGRLEESTRELQQAQELDPLSLEINTDLGLSFFIGREYDKAIEQFRKAIEMDPHFIWGRFFLAWACEQKGDLASAINEYKLVAAQDDTPVIRASLGYAYALAGQPEETHSILKELTDLSRQKHVSPYDFTVLHTALGDLDHAFDCLERAYESRSEALVWLKVDPRLDALRADPRFTDLLRRVGLDDAG